MDDLELGNVCANALGIEFEEKSVTEERLEQDRLGGGSIIANFGITSILISISLLLIILIVSILVCIFKRICNSEKWRERRIRLRDAIFFNPLIRFLILNANKLNISAIVALKTF